MSTSMDPVISVVLIVGAYKVVSLFVGLAFAYMGYRLFIGGIEKPAGTIEASAGPNSIKMTRTAPGIFFAIFGAAIVAVTIYQGFDVQLPGNTQSILQKLPKDPPMVTQ